MEMVVSVAENGSQKEQTQNLPSRAEQVASSGSGEAVDGREPRLARNARKARLRRMTETEEQKRARLAKNAERARLRRGKEKEKSGHLPVDAEIFNTSELTHPQGDLACEKQDGTKVFKTSSEQIAPSTSNKTVDEPEARQKGSTPKRLDESEQRKERLAKVIDKVKQGKVKEIDQQIRRCYARIAEVIGTAGFIEVSHTRKDVDEEDQRHTSSSDSTLLENNVVSEPSVHTQDSVLYSLLSIPDEVSPSESLSQVGEKHDAGSAQQLSPTRDTNAIDLRQPLLAEAGVANVQASEGCNSRDSQSPDIIIIKEIVKTAGQMGTPTIPQKQPTSDASDDQGQTKTPRIEAEQLSSDNEGEPRSARARKAKLRRWAETAQQRKDRLEKEVERARMRRLGETEQQKRERLAKAAENARLRRSRETEQKKRERLSKAANAKLLKRRAQRAKNEDLAKGNS